MYYEDSDGEIVDNMSDTPTLHNKIVEIDGKKYQLKKV